MAISSWVAKAKTTAKRLALQALDDIAPLKRDDPTAGRDSAGNGAPASPGSQGRGMRRLRFSDSLETTHPGRVSPTGQGLFPDRAGVRRGSRPATGALHLAMAMAAIGVAIGVAMVALAVGIKVLVH